MLQDHLTEAKIMSGIKGLTLKQERDNSKPYYGSTEISYHLETMTLGELRLFVTS